MELSLFSVNVFLFVLQSVPKSFFFSKPHRDLFRKLCEIRIGHILVKIVNLNHHHCDGM